MNSMQENLMAWLSSQRRQRLGQCYLLAAGSLLLGGVVLLLTYYITYFLLAFLWASLGPLLGWTSARRALLHPLPGLELADLVFLGLLFAGNARTSREYLGDLPKGNWEWRYHRGDAHPVASLMVTAKWLTDILYTGPRLVMGFFGFLKKATAWRKLDVESGARLLGALVASNHPVAPDELDYPALEIDPEAMARLLSDLDGVVWVRERLALTPEFRAELNQQIYAAV